MNPHAANFDHILGKVKENVESSIILLKKQTIDGLD
jgi:hypothetical protein